MALTFVFGCNKNAFDTDVFVGDSALDSKSSISSDGDWLDVQAGSGFTCGLRTDGTIQCWSCIESDSSFKEVCESPTGNFSQISTSGWASCALDYDGVMSCWGKFFTEESIPLASSRQSVAIFDVDGHHYCWVMRDQKHIQCESGVESTNYKVKWSDESIRSFSASYYSASILVESGEILYGDLTKTVAPNRREGFYTHVSSKYFDVCGILESSQLDCWVSSEGYVPLVPPAGEFEWVDVGEGFACAVSVDGKVQCWGEPNVDYGQNSPPDSTFTMVSAGYSHVCGLRTDGHIECWGDSTNGATNPP